MHFESRFSFRLLCLTHLAPGLCKYDPFAQEALATAAGPCCVAHRGRGYPDCVGLVSDCRHAVKLALRSAGCACLGLWAAVSTKVQTVAPMEKRRHFALLHSGIISHACIAFKAPLGSALPLPHV
ncbi:hypothetical protein BCR44DRAFT_291775 [Catenaria anguillulae PL171]|uniref:Secreted protein n=1 Tax=Catenaria anguillulae PL171 TaxID=765915 RepID=A0A1Y2HXL5_9FUNG|nr:hypothetical protein BCR44DRAFT_291775 [Catenaria anguillulae PL171]